MNIKPPTLTVVPAANPPAPNATVALSVAPPTPPFVVVIVGAPVFTKVATSALLDAAVNTSVSFVAFKLVRVAPTELNA